MGGKILFPNQNVVAGKYFSVDQDWEVPIAGFFVIACKRKIRTVAEFTDEEAQEFIRLLCAVRKGMAEALGIQDVYIFQNEDTDNFHPWLFPRHAWMEKFGRKIESVRPIMEYAKKHLTTDDDIRGVHAAVDKVRKYMQSEYPSGV
ncbi:MAG: diadenosine tetraphosphate hydrolase [Patescibacteria group bacterium]|nr:diadenosine tetraphosphate hydrolase [Patescibacteria group bacterium]